MADDYISPLPSGDELKAMLAKPRREAEQLQAFVKLLERGGPELARLLPPFRRKS